MYLNFLPVNLPTNTGSKQCNWNPRFILWRPPPTLQMQLDVKAETMLFPRGKWLRLE